MNIQNQFTLTLTNESGIYSNNTLYSFRTPVNPPIQLPLQEWEVALTKIQIPQSRQLFLPSSEFDLIIALYKKEDHSKQYHPIRISITIEEDFFTSLELVLSRVEDKVIAALIGVYQTEPNLFDISEGRLPGIRFSLRMMNSRIVFSEILLTGIPEDIEQISKIKIRKGIELWKHFGFKAIEMNRAYLLPASANHPPIFHEENSTLTLLAPNLVMEQYVGDRMIPILEMIPYNINTTADYIVFEQRYPLYKRIFGGYINHIQFELSNLNRFPIYFESGKVLLALHFRQCQPMIKW